MLNILLVPGDEIINRQHFVSLFNESITEV